MTQIESGQNLAVKAEKDGAQVPTQPPTDFLSLYQDTEESRTA